MTENRIRETITPVIKSVTVKRGVEDAFRIFTDGLADWWPLDGHSATGQAETCAMEGCVGGRL